MWLNVMTTTIGMWLNIAMGWAITILTVNFKNNQA